MNQSEYLGWFAEFELVKSDGKQPINLKTNRFVIRVIGPSVVLRTGPARTFPLVTDGLEWDQDHWIDTFIMARPQLIPMKEQAGEWVVEYLGMMPR